MFVFQPPKGARALALERAAIPPFPASPLPRPPAPLPTPRSPRAHCTHSLLPPPHVTYSRLYLLTSMTSRPPPPCPPAAHTANFPGCAAFKALSLRSYTTRYDAALSPHTHTHTHAPNPPHPLPTISLLAIHAPPLPRCLFPQRLCRAEEFVERVTSRRHNSVCTCCSHRVVRRTPHNSVYKYNKFPCCSKELFQ